VISYGRGGRGRGSGMPRKKQGKRSTRPPREKSTKVRIWTVTITFGEGGKEGGKNNKPVTRGKTPCRQYSGEHQGATERARLWGGGRRRERRKKIGRGG